MAQVAVLVPWQPGCPVREDVWRWVKARYRSQHPDWDVIEGVHEGPWCKALAVQNALRRTAADILVLADADVWCDGIPEAVDALQTHPWARPHHDVHRLTETATADFTTGALDRTTDPHPYHGIDGGGLVVIPRHTYEDIPLDPRFVGWGGEDHSWGLALYALRTPPWRGQAPLWHLWHPPQPDASKLRGPGGSRFLNDNNRRWLEAYKHAQNDPGSMRALVDEAKEILHGASEGDSEPVGGQVPAEVP